ncbi:hypothetical protein D8674_003793 [Pyrus ussuriensis x Pyrus communis]|uniref:Uncharacterized protein n=1 Tax=Pyrus ussuriensis x Pyrus communis TaxID=2448454 RepID=A0A5N5FI15_9ROSA|nr:hypothetical protein D8674_003793 [Pyrus ussuriensis x Pyrus communis]
MVYISGSDDEEIMEVKSMAKGSERAKPLHNFNLPWYLKWGNQIHLWCQKESFDASGSGGEGSGVNRQSLAQRIESSPTMMTRVGMVSGFWDFRDAA